MIGEERETIQALVTTGQVILRPSAALTAFVARSVTKALANRIDGLGDVGIVNIKTITAGNAETVFQPLPEGAEELLLPEISRACRKRGIEVAVFDSKGTHEKSLLFKIKDAEVAKDAFAEALVMSGFLPEEAADLLDVSTETSLTGGFRFQGLQWNYVEGGVWETIMTSDAGESFVGNVHPDGRWEVWRAGTTELVTEGMSYGEGLFSSLKGDRKLAATACMAKLEELTLPVPDLGIDQTPPLDPNIPTVGVRLGSRSPMADLVSLNLVAGGVQPTPEVLAAAVTDATGLVAQMAEQAADTLAPVVGM